MKLDGIGIAEKIKSILKEKIDSLSKKPLLTFVLVGNHIPSQIYVKLKEKCCKEIGIESRRLCFDKDISEKDLIKELKTLNKDKNINGILLQMPLPETINSSKIVSAIEPTKDVDGFHPLNIGMISLGNNNAFAPCTPLAVLSILEFCKVPVEGKHVVIVGRSNVVGKPLASLLLQKNPTTGNGTITVVHSKTINLGYVTKTADILVATAGDPLLIKRDMVKKNSIVIDVGINRVNGTLVGDVDYEEVSKIASIITPVPGGVGPITVAMLMVNTLKAYNNQNNI